MKRAIGILAIACLGAGLCLAAEFQTEEGKRVTSDFLGGLKAAKAKYAEDLVKVKAALDEKKASAPASEKPGIMKDLAVIPDEIKRAQGDIKGDPGELKGFQTEGAQQALAEYQAALKAARTRYIQDLSAAQRTLQIRKGTATDPALKAAFLEDMKRLGEEEQAARLEMKTGKFRRPPSDEMDKGGAATAPKLQCEGSAKPAPGGYLISGADADRVSTPDEVPVPFKARVVAMTDSANLQIYYGKGQVIFNNAEDQGVLLFNTFSAGHPAKFAGMGSLAPRLMATIDLVVTDTTTQVFVDGTLRITMKDNCKGLTGKIGVGPAKGSVVTLRSITILPIKEDAPAKDATPAKDAAPATKDAAPAKAAPAK